MGVPAQDEDADVRRHEDVMPVGDGCVVPGFLQQSNGIAGQRGARFDHRNRRFPARTTLFTQGDAANHLYRVTSGAIMVYHLMADGRRQIVNLAHEGDFVGISEFSLYECSAETLQDSEVEEYERRVYDNSPELMRTALTNMTHQVTEAQDLALTLGRKTAMERVSTFLLRHVPPRGRIDCPGPPNPKSDRTIVEISMTRQEIADYLGLTIETVSRSFSQLKQQGVIELKGKEEVAIVNVCALCHMASPR